MPPSRRCGLYVHLPFCLHRCSYCAFVSTTDLALAPAVVEATTADIRRHRRRRVLATLYLGGGTPSLVAPQLLGQLFAAIRSAFTLEPGAEVTLEANPEDVTPGALAAWRGLGVTRLSLGVQALDDRVLRLLERRHDAERARVAVGSALAAGFSVSVDLMLALPLLSLEAVEEGVREVVALGPQHVSVYLLEVDKPHRLGDLARQRPELFPGEDEAAQAYLAAARVLTRAGFRHYEVSNFARPGFQARHNLRTWRQRPLLAAGVAAHGHSGRARWANLESPAAYLRAVGRGERPLAWRRVLSEDELERERVMLALRLAEGVEWATAQAVARRLPAFARRLDDFLTLGLARLGSGRLRLSRRGWLVSSELLQTLW
ncbi:MAG: radical SAM family heme chaperone HemW [Acidobacteriota bacterium]